MSFQTEGKLYTKLEIQSGEGQKGPWSKQSFVIETFDQYPKKICLIAWTEKVELLKNVEPGDRLKIEFSVESREYQGRWYSDLRVIRLETFKDTKSVAPEQAPPAFNPEEILPEPGGIAPTDDLPF